MFRNSKNAIKTISFLFLTLLTTVFIIFIQLDMAVGATFDRSLGGYKITFVNHSDTAIDYDFTDATGGSVEITGSVEAGETKEAEFNIGGDATLEQGEVPLIGIIGKPEPYFRFWSDGVGHQLINAIAGNGYEVIEDNSEISEIYGNGFRISVDGGGNDDPSTEEIYVQVYNQD